MESKKCVICEKKFYKSPSDSKSYWLIKKCCGKKCSEMKLKKGKFVLCDWCKKKRWIIPSLIKKSKKHYCSSLCASKGFSISRKGHVVTEKTRKKIRIARAKQIIPKEIYTANGLRMRGSHHWNWKGGRHLNGDGYFIVYCPNHPRANNHGYVKEHRIIAEKHLGRFLTKDETIHHINEIKTDNRIENFYLFPTNKDHRIYHIRNRFGKVEKIAKSNL